MDHFIVQELSAARALLLRLRTRDLFVLAGEVLLSHDRYEALRLSRRDSIVTNSIIRNELHALIRANHNHRSDDDRSSCPVEVTDLFCEVIKMNYGKGNVNPVDGPTAFYTPKRRTEDDCDDDPMHHPHPEARDHDDDRSDLMAAVGTFQSMDEQDRYWSVGTVPQGNYA